MNKKKSFYIGFVMSLMFITIPLISIGYAALQTTLNISGDFIMLGKPTLYNVLKNAASEGSYARQYTAQHQDSISGTGTENIYTWDASTSAAGSTILDSNNVIFADHCWQMIRTTDTGGVKMIYNGEPENNQCLSTRGTHVGYSQSKVLNMNTSYYYGSSYEYNPSTNLFSLSGTVTTGSVVIGSFTCNKTTESGTCQTLYYVNSLNSGSSYNVFGLVGTTNYSQIGVLPFSSNGSPSFVGYMYNTAYTTYEKQMEKTETVFSSASLGTSYWYGEDAVWGTPVANRYNLINGYQVSSNSDYPSLVGKYTFRSSTQNYTNTSVMYIAGVNNSTFYYISLQSGNGLSDYNYTLTYGDSYIDNGNGTYTINNSSTMSRTDWYSNYSLAKSKYVCKNATNNVCSDLWYVFDTTSYNMSYLQVSNVKYANGYTWDGTKYILDNNSILMWDVRNSSNQRSIDTKHYTCWNENGECTSVSFVYHLDDYNHAMYYVNLTGGTNIQYALNRMLYDNDVNTYNSIIKNGIDKWYEWNLLDYTDYIEETIFCNDRKLHESGETSWEPNGGHVTDDWSITFNNYYSLSCTNETDRFSINNSKAKLDYSIGLMTLSETYLLGNSRHLILKTGSNYWLGSPLAFTNGMGNGSDTLVNYISNYGYSNYSDYSTNMSLGVRPVISLIPDIEYISGDGSTANPYVVDATPNP